MSGSSSAPSHTAPHRGGSTAIVGVTITSMSRPKGAASSRVSVWVSITDST